uniref:glutathione-specific gamma-glutamylcyclotransferase n=1 Tax=Cacopsylla melanoneura TaxID=428564 RepID=A0A8D8X541_9HEMI
MDSLDISSPEESSSIWVFGYGSLCWHPGFEFEKSTTGYVKGYSRKFWQGNDQHRGTSDSPGRVATLVQQPENIVWGRAFLVCGKSAVPYLNTREGVLGGYMTSFEEFYPKDHSEDDRPIRTMMFVACPDNSLWLGDAPLHEIANQIVSCKGPSGHNAEYVLRLAIFMRENIPDAHLHDPELFTLEIMLLSRIKEQKIPLHIIMNEPSTSNDNGSSSSNYQDDLDVRPVARRSFDFTARLPNKNLRCVNIN